jgi:hypothetical protein
LGIFEQAQAEGDIHMPSGASTAMQEVMENYNSADDRVDKLYEAVSQPNFDWGTPTQGEFDSFLSTFSNWVAREKKKVNDGATSPQSRADLIEYIRTKRPSYPQAVFAGIDPAVFGMQLAMRVRRPRSINQGRTGLCGAVSAVYIFAKTRPREFVQLALDLFFRGKGIFGNMEVTPSDAIRNNYRLRRSKIPWAVDYVLLVSLRQCTFLSDRVMFGPLRGGDETTMPGQLGYWLEEAGYENVQDHTFFGKNQHKVVKNFAKVIEQPMYMRNNTAGDAARNDRKQLIRQNLQDAADSIAAGKLVILFSAGKLTQALSDKTSADLTAQNGPVTLGGHHWTPVRKLQIFRNRLWIKVISWGKSYESSFDLDAFSSYYSGYIAADPGA